MISRIKYHCLLFLLFTLILSSLIQPANSDVRSQHSQLQHHQQTKTTNNHHSSSKNNNNKNDEKKKVNHSGNLRGYDSQKESEALDSKNNMWFPPQPSQIETETEINEHHRFKPKLSLSSSNNKNIPHLHGDKVKNRDQEQKDCLHQDHAHANNNKDRTTNSLIYFSNTPNTKTPLLPVHCSPHHYNHPFYNRNTSSFMKTMDHIDPKKRKEKYEKLAAKAAADAEGDWGSTSTGQQQQLSAQERLSKYYTGRALDFLRQYGKYYHLFDTFLPPNMTAMSSSHHHSTSQSYSISPTIHYDIPSAFMHHTDSASSSSHDKHSAYSTAISTSPMTEISTSLWHADHSLQENGHLIRDFGHYTKWNVARVKSTDNTDQQQHRDAHFDFSTIDSNQKVSVSETTQEYNNRYRYGSGINDRFLAIGFDRDPWGEDDEHTTTHTERHHSQDQHEHTEFSHSHKSAATDNDRETDNNQDHNHGKHVYIYFIGVDNDFPNSKMAANSPSHDLYRCVFTYPIASESEVEIENNLLSAVSTPTKNNRIRCRVPDEILYYLRSHHNVQHHTAGGTPAGETTTTSSTTTATSSAIHRIEFDFIHSYYINRTITIQNSNKMKYNKTREFYEHQTLLKGISLYRGHPLDYRHFPYTVQTMIDNLNDPLVIEWIIYNILLGVEHFYFYVNHEMIMTSTWHLEHCLIKPFLESNIVTLIYFPFYHTEHFNKVQYAALNAHVHLFGKRFNHWVGYWDVDEFYVPAHSLMAKYWGTTGDYNNRRLDDADIGHHHGSGHSSDKTLDEGEGEVVAPNYLSMSLLHFVTKNLAIDPRNPAIMFDTLEMDCESDVEGNYYHGGNNFLPFTDLYSTIIGKGKQSKASKNNGGTSAIEESPYAGRFSMSLYCTRSGYLFEELKVSHGKMLVRPNKLESHLASPHRLNHYYVVWTKPETGGTIRHFNRFRNTNGAISQGLFTAKQISHDDSLRKLTLKLLKELVGVSIY